MPYQQEKQVALAAVTAAAQLCEQVRRAKNLSTFTKADRSPVTLADLGSQALICRYLSEAFAEPIIAEEDAQMLSDRDLLHQITDYIQQQLPDATPEEIAAWIDKGNANIAPRYWTLDPIDGTKGFIRGDQYAIALALIEQGQVKVGVLGCPALSFPPNKGVLFVAVQDEGTYLTDLDGDHTQPVHVNQTDIEQVRLIESVEAAHSDRPQQEAISKILGLTQTPIRMDSQAKYGAVARGDADLYLRIPLPQDSSRRENIWDHAAGAIVVSEAGGRVTDLDGQPLDFSVGAKLAQNRGIVASNGSIHEQVLKAVKICTDSKP